MAGMSLRSRRYTTVTLAPRRKRRACRVDGRIAATDYHHLASQVLGLAFGDRLQERQRRKHAL